MISRKLFSTLIQSIYLLICLSVCPSVRPFVHPSVRQSVRPSVHPSIHPSIHPTIHPSIHPSVIPSVRPSVCLSVCLSFRPSVQPSNHQPTHPYPANMHIWDLCGECNSSMCGTLEFLTSLPVQDGGPHDFRSKMAAPTTPRWRPHEIKMAAPVMRSVTPRRVSQRPRPREGSVTS